MNLHIRVEGTAAEISQVLRGLPGAATVDTAAVELTDKVVLRTTDSETSAAESRFVTTRFARRALTRLKLSKPMRNLLRAALRGTSELAHAGRDVRRLGVPWLAVFRPDGGVWAPDLRTLTATTPKPISSSTSGTRTARPGSVACRILCARRWRPRNSFDPRQYRSTYPRCAGCRQRVEDDGKWRWPARS